jgi:hypothetical protein
MLHESFGKYSFRLSFISRTADVFDNKYFFITISESAYSNLYLILKINAFVQ